MESILYFVSLKIYYRLFVRIYLRNRGRIAQIEKPPTEAGGGLSFGFQRSLRQHSQHTDGGEQDQQGGHFSSCALSKLSTISRVGVSRAVMRIVAMVLSLASIR